MYRKDPISETEKDYFESRQLTKRVMKKRKRKQVRNAIVLLGFICIVVLSFCLIHKDTVSASNTTNQSLYCRTIEIQKGDTLWTIAQEYMTEEWGTVEAYVKEIKRANGYVTNTIYTGHYISIPYYR